MTIWVFGDSYAEQYPNLKDQWMKRVADHLDTNVRSFGLVGSSTEFTYHAFNNVRHEFKKNDIIILTLTTHSRRWFFKLYPSHTAQPMPNTDFKSPVSIYSPTGFKEIDESLELYEEFLNNQEVAESHLQNFLYNLNGITKKLNLHTIVILNFYDTAHFLEDKKDQFANLHFTKDTIVNVSLNEFTKNYIIEYNNFKKDTRVNHLIRSNHIILADKIIDNIKNKTTIDLTMGFIKHTLSEEQLTNKEFIHDQLFGGILK